MNSVKQLLLAAMLVCGYSVQAIPTARNQFTTRSAEQQLAAAQALANKYFFSPELQASNEAKNIAYATHSVLFANITEKNNALCLYDYLGCKSTLTKYEKKGSSLIPVKSEEFTGKTEGGTKCTRKGKGARAIKEQDGIARLLRATAKPNAITQVTFLDAYKNCVPMWVRAKSAQDVQEFIECVKDDLTDAAIDPLAQPEILKPILILTIEGDLFLDSIDAQLWQDLQSVYTVTTFADAELRKYIWEIKTALADTIQQGEHDINPNFWECVFEDLAEENYGFSWKKGTRKLIKEVFSIKHVVMFVSAVIGISLAQATGKAIHDRLFPQPEKTSVVNLSKNSIAELAEALAQSRRAEEAATTA